ncbi:putative RNA methyltransferase At5g10620 [Bidens hawaiensis]|uniref:putative RNA methyltransferase At5g10620 n=1 Tax=Bidens hawaiensis TaxID=980011 RepID=UPI0040495588
MGMCIMNTINMNNNRVLNSGAKTRGSKYAGQSVKPLPIHILTVGKTRSPGVQLILKDYMDKLKPYCPVHDLRIRSNPKNSTEPRVQIENEETGFMNFIKQDDWVVMLDENGVDMRSEEVADMIGDVGSKASGSRLVFCIGGAYGHGMKLRERANVKLKLSSLVLNHEIALVVLVEQLYRAWTILKGQKYHH